MPRNLEKDLNLLDELGGGVALEKVLNKAKAELEKDYAELNNLEAANKIYIEEQNSTELNKSLDQTDNLLKKIKHDNKVLNSINNFINDLKPSLLHRLRETLKAYPGRQWPEEGALARLVGVDLKTFKSEILGSSSTRDLFGTFGTPESKPVAVRDVSIANSTQVSRPVDVKPVEENKQSSTQTERSSFGRTV